jgi:Leucine-rich repeat (LRR) protein
MFRFLQKGKDVEELNLNENNFRTTDFLEIPNLRSLSLRLNRIESLQVTAKKLDQLRFLDLCGNGIGHLKFG